MDSPTRHSRHRSDAVFPANVEQSPAYRYAQLDEKTCYEELTRRAIPFRRESEPRPGITQAVRLTGALNGVEFRTDRPESERPTTPYELFDCRLLLALEDFTKLLRAEEIRLALLSSAYRPPPKALESVSQGKRHGGGLAVDIHRFQRDDGSWVRIDRDFHGRLGAPVCGKSAPGPIPASPEAKLLRRLVCGAADQRLFQSILTPNYDVPHRNHVHLELTLGVRWFIVS